jgi:hypothetical protein
LRHLYSGITPLSRRFLNNIRVFNNAFAFTSLGADNYSNQTQNKRSVIPGRGPIPFQAKSNLYHRLGPLRPSSEQAPCYAQIYFHDSNQDSRISINQRLDFIFKGHQQIMENNAKTKSASQSDQEKDKTIVKILENSITSNNYYALMYKTAAQRIQDANGPILKIELLSQPKKSPKANARLYNNPTANEVAAILPGDGTQTFQDRDIMVQPIEGGFKRVSALSACYWPLGYPLLFPRGENGFQLGLKRKPDTLDPLPVQYADLPTLMDDHQDEVNTEFEQVLESDSDEDAESEQEIDLHYPDSEVEIVDNDHDKHDDDHDCSGIEPDDNEIDNGSEHEHNVHDHRITMKDDFSYRLQLRHGDNSQFILRSKHLLQQWAVDMFCTMDMNNLNFYVKNQEKVRASLYNGMYINILMLT